MSQKIAHLQFKKLLLVSTVSMMAALLPSTRVEAAVGDTELPTDFSLVSGNVNKPVTNGANMDVTQTSDRAVVNWGTFNIGKDASVKFDQKAGNHSVIVNRVTNSTIDGSQILGQLLANGKVVILDRNGVLFGATSQVDAGGIIASTGHLDAENETKFMNNQAFTLNNLDAVTSAKIVAAAGSMVSAKDNGLVAFVAPHVANHGTINAKLGQVTLAAGKKVTVDLTGDSLITLAADETLAKAYVENSGTIDAQGGVVTMTTKAASSVVDNVVNMSGVVNATSFQQKNGKIVLSAPGGKVKVSGKLDASRAAADSAAGTTAGDIEIKAKEVEITTTAELKANVQDAAATPVSNIEYTTEKRIIVLQEATSGKYLGVSWSAPAVTVEIDVTVPKTTTSYNAEQGHGAGGTVTVHAEDLASIAGLIDVRGGSQGGSIDIQGRDVQIAASGVLDASIADAAANSGIENLFDTVSQQVTVYVPKQTVTIKVFGVNVPITYFPATTRTITVNVPRVFTNVCTSSNHAGNGGSISVTATNNLGMSGRADAGAAGLGGDGGSVLLRGDNQLSFNGQVDTSAANGDIGDATFRSSVVSVGDLIDTSALNTTLSRANVLLSGSEQVRFASAADLSRNGLLVNKGDLRLQAPTISLLGGLTFGSGALTFEDVDTIDLGGKIQRHNGLFATSLGRNDLFSNAGTVNVLGAGADLNQAIHLASSTALSTVNVAAGSYTNDLLNLLQPLDIYKSLRLMGNGATLTAMPVKVTADDVTVDGFTFVAGQNAVTAKDVSNLTVNNNTFNGFIDAAVALENVTGATVAGNTVNLGNVGIRITGGSIVAVNGNTLLGMLSRAIDIDGANDVTVQGNIVTAAGGEGISIANSADIDVRENIVAGAGAAALSLDNVSDADVRLNALGGSDTGLDIENSSDVNVALNLIGLTSGDGLRMTNVNDGKAYLNAIVEAGGNGITIEGGSDALLAGNIVYGAGGHGISITGADNVRVLLNAMIESGMDGIYINGATNSVAIVNAIVNSAGNGINVANSAGAIIAANLVQGAGADGLRVSGSDDAILAANYIKDVKGNGIALSDSARILAALNKISQTGGNGISVSGGDNHVVTLNDIDNAGNDGIALDGTSASVIAANIVAKSGRDGVSVSGGSENAVLLNNVDSAARDGIRIAADKTLVAGNDVDAVGRHGIALDGAGKTIVTLNDVDGSGADGISATDSKETLIVENDVTGAGRDGIAVKGGKNNAVVSNDVTGAGRDGVSLKDTSATIVTLNDVDGSGADGISATDSKETLIVENDVTGAGRDGIAVKGGKNNAVVSNDVTGAGRDGIRIAADKTLVASNDVDAAGRHGIALDGAGKTIVTLNDVDGSGADGISATDSKETLIVENDVTGAGRDGIAVKGGKNNAVVSNDVTGAGRDGIRLADTSAALVSGNDVDGSARDGIYALRSGDILVLQNDITQSGRDGIRFAGSTGLIIDNKVQGTGRDGIALAKSGALIAANDVTGAGRDGISLRKADGSLVLLNNVDTAGRNGISVARSGSVAVAGNSVTDATVAGISLNRSRDVLVALNGVSGGQNGVAIEGGRSIAVAGNQINGAENGIVVDGTSRVAIAYNRITGYIRNGVQLLSGRNAAIVGNDIDGSAGAGTTGIRLGADNATGDMSGSDNVLIQGNTIANNAVGLSAMAFNNGDVTLAGNSFIYNSVGMWAGSGLFDMTGASNTFTGGDTALRFQRQSYDTVNGQNQPVTVFADLGLVGDTIGTTVFSGQSGYYADLRNQAFFENGQPVLIDGTQATYDGVSGGFMTAEQLLAIRGKIHDFNNDPTLGLFFAGYASLDDNLLMKRVLGNTYRAGKASITVNNRPVTPSAVMSPAGSQNQFFSIQDLAGLEPAAGGDDKGQPQASDLANLEPAAGGVSEAKCWSNIGGASGAVNLDLSGDASAILEARSGCAGGI